MDEETGLYYYGARYYDPRTSVWISVDPLAEQMPTTSSYVYCFNNPLGFIDPTGMKPSDKEAALLADDVYRTNNGQYKPGEKKTDLKGWELSDRKFDGVVLTDDNSGFNSAVYQKKIGVDKSGNNIYDYAYVTQGTDPTSSVDWKNNALQAAGEFSPQYNLSVNNARALNRQIGSSSLTFVGHSLGGGLASANALATGRPAVTFNAAGISSGSRNLYGGLHNNATITAYVVNGEAVSQAQGTIGLKAEGSIVKLPASYLPIIPLAPQQYNAGAMVVNAGLSIYNHTMGSVISKMTQLRIK